MQIKPTRYYLGWDWFSNTQFVHQFVMKNYPSTDSIYPLAKVNQLKNYNGLPTCSIVQARRNIWGQWGFVPTYFCQIHQPYYNHCGQIMPITKACPNLIWKCSTVPVLWYIECWQCNIELKFALQFLRLGGVK
jgi:hypothetical protein